MEGGQEEKRIFNVEGRLGGDGREKARGSISPIISITPTTPIICISNRQRIKIQTS